MIDEINTFKKELSKHFTVFDPATIDELPLEISGSGRRNISLTADDHWPVQRKDTLCQETRSDITVRASEVREISKGKKNERSELRRNVHMRDYRLIDQSDFVAIYRPTYGGRPDWSGGTYHEARYASKTLKHLIIIQDPSVDGDLSNETIGFEPAEHQCITSVSRLNKPQNQKRAIEELIRRINSMKIELINRRIKS
jgi:hypothetical protein